MYLAYTFFLEATCECSPGNQKNPILKFNWKRKEKYKQVFIQFSDLKQTSSDVY